MQPIIFTSFRLFPYPSSLLVENVPSTTSFPCTTFPSRTPFGSGNPDTGGRLGTPLRKKQPKMGAKWKVPDKQEMEPWEVLSGTARGHRTRVTTGDIRPRGTHPMAAPHTLSLLLFQIFNHFLSLSLLLDHLKNSGYTRFRTAANLLCRQEEELRLLQPPSSPKEPPQPKLGCLELFGGALPFRGERNPLGPAWTHWRTSVGGLHLCSPFLFSLSVNSALPGGICGFTSVLTLNGSTLPPVSISHQKLEEIRNFRGKKGHVFPFLSTK